MLGGFWKRLFGARKNVHPARAALENISAAIEEARSVNFDERARACLQRVLEQDVPEFLDLRESMVEEIGLGPYAEMIGYFAGVERNVDRALAAILTKSLEEIPAALQEADLELAHAIASLERALTRERPADEDVEAAAGDV